MLKLAKIPGSCVMVTVLPPIVTVPLRDPPGLAAAVTVIEPFPLPPDDTVRNELLLEAVQLQLESAVTPTLTLPPPLLAFALVMDSVTEHPVGATSTGAAWVKTAAALLTTMLADRAAPVLAAML